jgi:hypothetical protein
MKVVKHILPSHLHSPLKNGLLDETAEVCLITKDPSQPYKDLVKEQGIRSITKVEIS